ncbi:MAG: hypothetical protein L3J82_07540 [Planctomycetes bacterium]|nr:hypothetical protein [Planctomycetota bacterium]
MADLAKLASLSKRLKSSKPKVNVEKSALSGPMGGGDDSDSSPAPAPSAPAAAPVTAAVATAAPVATGGGGPTNVTVNVDLDPLKNMMSKIRDELKELRSEIKKTRDKGMKIEFGDDTAEQMDQVVKHLSSVSKAGRELTEKLVTSMPESRWYGDILAIQRETGENMAIGAVGGGGGGGNPEEIAEIKESLEMQQTQLTAILSILQRK